MLRIRSICKHSVLTATVLRGQKLIWKQNHLLEVRYRIWQTLKDFEIHGERTRYKTAAGEKAVLRHRPRLFAPNPRRRLQEAVPLLLLVNWAVELGVPSDRRAKKQSEVTNATQDRLPRCWAHRRSGSP